MAPKRKRELDDSDIADAFTRLEERTKLDLWSTLQQLVAVRGDLTEDVTIFLSQLQNACKINANIIEATRLTLPSFSKMAWEDLTARVELLADPDDMIWSPTETYALPLSLQATLFKAGSQAATMYFRPATILHLNEAARSRILEAYLTPIVNIFKGYIVDKPEEAMEGTEISSGGKVEHELFVIGGAIFLVVELKRVLDSRANVAQLFAEQYSAAQMNNKSEFHKDLPVYGVLTDLATFSFYTFNPVTRTFHADAILGPSVFRDQFLQGMVPVANKLFSVILSAYIESLEATESLSKQRSQTNDVSKPSSALVSRGTQTAEAAPATDTKRSGRPSLTLWQQALRLAREARDKLSASVSTAEERDQNAEDAIRLLEESVFATPDASKFLRKGITKADAREAVRLEYTKMGLA